MRVDPPVRAMPLDMDDTVVDGRFDALDALDALDDLVAVTPDFTGLADLLPTALSTTSDRP